MLNGFLLHGKILSIKIRGNRLRVAWARCDAHALLPFFSGSFDNLMPSCFKRNNAFPLLALLTFIHFLMNASAFCREVMKYLAISFSDRFSLSASLFTLVLICKLITVKNENWLYEKKEIIV